MKHLVKKLSTLFIVAVLAVTMLLPATANAKERAIKYRSNLVVVKDPMFASFIRFPERITSYTSSNKKFTTTDLLQLDEDQYVTITPYTKASTFLSFVGKSGKIYNMNFKIVNYTNPVSKFKINSKNYAKKFKKSTEFSKEISGKQKISGKAKRGWKIVGLYYTTYNYSGKYKTKKIKNNHYVNISKKYSGYVDVTLKNKKTNAITVLTLCVGPQF